MHGPSATRACLAVLFVKSAHFRIGVHADNGRIVALHDNEMQAIWQLELCDAVLEPPLQAIDACV